MNRRLLIKFTPQIIRGAERLGLDAKALRALLAIKEQFLAELTYGIEDLTVRQATLLERATGRSIGELAILGIEREMSPGKRARHAGLIRDTLEMFAASRPDASRTATTRRNSDRPKRPASTTKRRPNGTRARAA